MVQKKYKAAIFDLDGTLINIHPSYREIGMKTILGKFGIEPTEAEVEEFWFNSGRSEIAKKVWGVEPRDFWREFIDFDTVNRLNYVEPYDDIGVLCELKSGGVKIGVVTSSIKQIADAEVDLLRVQFDYVVSLNREICYKPNPAGLLLCSERLGIGPTEATYTGNAREDVEAARNAGMFDVVVNRGESDGFEPSLEIRTLRDPRFLALYPG